MRLIGFYWGIGGVIGILFFAVFRLFGKVLEMTEHSLSAFQWLVMLAFVLYMAYAEGYKGFHLNFAPRVVARANCLRHGQNSVKGILPLLLAPLFCMGYFHATRKRIITSFMVTAAIISVVLLVGMVPQPWRGIVDAGVVVGLGIGITSILRFWVQLERGTWTHPISADLPL